MWVKLGTSRAVLLLPFIGIAVKFPRIHFVKLAKYFWYNLRPKRIRIFVWFFTAPHDHWHSFRFYTVHGIYENLAEYNFYKKTANKCVWPTTYSFFGLFNIQPLGKPCDPNDPFWKQFFAIAGRDIRDTHCFENPANYCRGNNGKIYLLDYASENSQQVLSKYESELRINL